MSRPASGRRFVRKLLSFGAMAGVGALLVATSLPANAFQSASVEEVATSAVVEKQSVTVLSAAEHTVDREGYTVEKPPPPKPKIVRVAAVHGSYSNNPNGTIQWPFATGVPISSGYGERVACSYCSSNHQGVDFVPGAGAPIQAIADGVVREVNTGGSAYGVNVIIDHEINGQKVTSLYAHMRWGSPAVAAGQAVTVGQYLGDVGSTGASTGPHLHLEIHVDEKPLDPFVWLKANAN